MNETLIVTLFVIFAIIYFSILGGVIYLSYRYIKYINDLDKTGCKCSEDTKRDMVKNFSYLILIGWLLFIVILLVSPPKQLINIYTSKIYAIIQFLIIGGYGAVLFLYSKKLIDESCACSDSWVREAMQYQSYVYILLSVISLMVFIVKLLIGKDDTKDLLKIIKVLANNKSKSKYINK